MRNLSALAVVVALGAATQAAAADSASCCLQSTSRLDSLMNPTRGSDEKFFTTGGGPPNILFVLDTSCSMHDWPEAWPTVPGCTDPAYNFINAIGYNPTVAYNQMYSNIDTIVSQWFEENSYYVGSTATGTPSPPGDNGTFGVNFTGSPLGTKYADTTAACAPYVGNESACATCLGTKGFYVNGAAVTDRVMKGNFLNLYAPRDSGAVSVITQLVNDVRDVRLGIQMFGADQSTCWGGGRPKCQGGTNAGTNCKHNGDCTGGGSCGGSYLCHYEDIRPKCGESFPFVSSAVQNNRNAILGGLQASLSWVDRTPLAGALYAAGHYLKNKNGTDQFAAWFGAGYPTSSDFDESNVADQRSICASCGFNAIILLTDGEPNLDTVIALPAAITAQSVTCVGGACTSLDPAKVAKWWFEHDMRADHAGTQKVATYTIGFAGAAASSGTLKTIAAVGGGKFFGVNNTAALKNAVYTIIDDISNRNTSFSSAAITSLQTAGGSLAAVLPRFSPQRDNPWAGRLYRFEQFNEFVEDVNKNPGFVQTDGGLDIDKSDIFIVDSAGVDGTGTAGDIVVEDADGLFVKQSSGAPAVPYWEAGSKLVTRGYATRNVITVRDSNDDGTLTQADSQIAFTTANAAALQPYLGIVGTSFCPKFLVSNGDMFDKFGVTPDNMSTLLGLPIPASQSDLDTICVSTLIQFIRGRDLADEDGDADRDETRASVLGDIFHSSPVVVDPPVDKFLCDLGIANQCIRTLYSTRLGVTQTPLAAASYSNACGSFTGDAYDGYHNANRRRDKVILSGANDGMLHAFHDGNADTEVCLGGNPTSAYPSRDSTCGATCQAAGADPGTEMWAFIPPDMLPRLQELVFGHGYFVDGDIMVRDIWADGSGASSVHDGIKQADEFHTMAVIADGRGGTHYMALEIKFSSTGNVIDPGFRWMFPQPCTTEASTFGKTLYALSPKPPPIGPVLLEASGFTAPAPPTTTVDRYTCTGTTGTTPMCATSERWVTMLSGGWSPSLERGHGVYMVDVWNGSVNGRKDNLLWKMEHNTSASGEQENAQNYMRHSIVSPVAMVDYGKNGDPRLDGFFDTAVFGDTGGEIWLARFFKPGHLDTTTKLIDNWSGGRVFEMDRYAYSSGQKSSVNDWPFHYISSVGIQPDNGIMRIFTGTGNRYALLEPLAGTCRFDNPAACSKYDCDEVRTTYKIKKTTHDLNDFHMHWEDQEFKHSRLARGGASESMCASAGNKSVEAEFSDHEIKKCPRQTGGDIDPGDIGKLKFECGQDALGNFFCKRTDSTIQNLVDVSFTPKTGTVNGLGKNRFYGIYAYGGPDATRSFEEDRTTTNASYKTAKQFDGSRLTDRTSASPTSGDLVNVTATTCTSAGCTGSVGTTTGKGWFIEYAGLDHKTASGSALLASCVLWNALLPSSAVASCGNPAVAVGRFYQADFITGEPNCAAGFLQGTTYARYLDRGVFSPPPEPATAIQLSKTGQIRYSALLVEPGSNQATEANVTGGGDLLQSVYEIPISRELHKCRHSASGGAANANCVEVPP